MHVSDLMTSPAVAVGPDTPLKDVARVLVRHGLTGVPVVDDGHLVGVVSQTDIIRLEQRAEDECLRKRPAGRSARTARDVMSSPAVTVDPRSSAVGAAWAMAQRDVTRLPVVERGRLVGILSCSDLVRAYTRSDEQVRHEIVAEVLPALDVSRNDVEVRVDNGVVTVRGEVEDDRALRCLPHAIRGVVGVVDVVSELTARHEYRLDRVSARL